LYLAVLATVTFCGLWSGSRLALSMAFFLVLAPAVSALCMVRSARRLTAALTMESSCRSGQDPHLQLHICSCGLRSHGRLRAQLLCQNHVFGTEDTAELVLQTGLKKAAVYDVPFDSSLCGMRTVTVQKVTCSDLMGLFCCKVKAQQSLTCTVYPFEGQIHIDFRQHHDREQPGEIYDGRRSGMDVSEIFGLREDQEGDSLRSIHWKLSGKLDQLIVREYGRPINYHTLLLLDPAFQAGGAAVTEAALNGVFDLATSVSSSLLRQNIAHFVGYLQAGQLRCMPVDSESSYHDMLMNIMNAPIPEKNDETLYTFLDQQLYQRFTKMVYIAPHVDEQAVRRISGLLNLTVLMPAQSDLTYLGGERYDILSISTQELRRQETVITL